MRRRTFLKGTLMGSAAAAVPPTLVGAGPPGRPLAGVRPRHR
ncbi:twin-arginine translocation signal domain-containing protein [Streptomyces sp. NPDC127123]